MIRMLLQTEPLERSGLREIQVERDPALLCLWIFISILCSNARAAVAQLVKASYQKTLVNFFFSPNFFSLLISSSPSPQNSPTWLSLRPTSLTYWNYSLKQVRESGEQLPYSKVVFRNFPPMPNKLYCNFSHRNVFKPVSFVKYTLLVRYSIAS